MAMAMAMAMAAERSGLKLCEDLVIEILLRLPVASLMRFKSVCKSWLALIQSSDFASRHARLSNSKCNQDNNFVVLNLCSRLLREYDCFTPNFVSVSNDHHVSSKYVELVPPMDGLKKKRNCELIASFNGIICLKYNASLIEIVSLWNPATKQLRTLPPPHVEYCHWTKKIVYGFGFDSQANDYKVVRLSWWSSDSKLTTEVYSLNSDSWRTIDVALPPHVSGVSECTPKMPFQGEIYCWRGFNRGISQRNTILTFNFRREEFGTIPVPEVYANRGILKLSFISEKIACINSERDQDTRKRCTIWVLDEYSAKISWTKLYTLVLDEFYTPVGFSMDGKIFLRRLAKLDSLSLFDPRSDEMKEVPIQGRDISGVAHYNASLVSVQRRNDEIAQLRYHFISTTLRSQGSGFCEVQHRYVS